MRPVTFAILALLGLGATAASAGPRLVHGVPASALADAGRRAAVSAVDYDEDRCDSRTAQVWLKALAGAEARAIDWRGGPCELVGPGIDAGGRWCAQAIVTLAHPRSRADRPMIEIYFEAPVKGRPGRPYAFRGAMEAADGMDISRFRKDFESDWASRFKVPAGAIVDCEE